ncbi:MAG: TPM domain-containing protein [Rhodothermales bacterium]
MHAFRLFVVLMFLGWLGACTGESPLQPDWISDQAGVLTQNQTFTLSNLVLEHWENTTAQIVGVTVDDLEGRTIEEYTRQLANEWGVGEAGVNNGAMILVSINDRQVHLDVGYGMEWQVTDSLSARIVEEMVPFFKEDDFYTGLRTGFERLIAANEGGTWKVAYGSMDDALQAGEEAAGQIVVFEVTVTQIGEDALEVTTPGDERVKMLLTPHTDPALFEWERPYLFHARVQTVDPPVVSMLGFEEMEAL